MIFLTTLLFSVSVGLLVWSLASQRKEKHRISDRVRDISNQAFQMKPADATPDQQDLSLTESYQNNLVRDLYLADIREAKKVRFYKMIKNLPLILVTAVLFMIVLSRVPNFSDFSNTALLGIGTYAFIRIYIKNLKKHRQQKISRALPQFFDMLVVCLEAGLTLTAAIPKILEDMDQNLPLTKELNMLNKEYLGGLSLKDACDRLAKRCEVTDLSIILSSIVQSDQLGTSLASVLRVQAEELRHKRLQQIRQKSHTAPVKMLFPMALIFLGILALTLLPPVLHLVASFSQAMGK